MRKKSSFIEPNKLIEAVPEAAEELVLPHLVSIYDERPDQTGTGFLTAWNGRPLLVTAKHVLFGQEFDQDQIH